MKSRPLGMSFNYNLTKEERDMLGAIGDVMPLDNLEFDVLYQAYRSIKIQGCAFKIDISQIVSLGIPLYKALADDKSVGTHIITNQINNGSIPYEDIKQAFIVMTSKDGIFYNPIERK